MKVSSEGFAAPAGPLLPLFAALACADPASAVPGAGGGQGCEDLCGGGGGVRGAAVRLLLLQAGADGPADADTRQPWVLAAWDSCSGGGSPGPPAQGGSGAGAPSCRPGKRPPELALLRAWTMDHCGGSPTANSWRVGRSRVLRRRARLAGLPMWVDLWRPRQFPCQLDTWSLGRSAYCTARCGRCSAAQDQSHGAGTHACRQ